MAIEQYRQIVQQIIVERAERHCSQPGVEAQAVLDSVRDRYLLLHTGWNGNRRTHGCSIHIDIIDIVN